MNRRSCWKVLRNAQEQLFPEPGSGAEKACIGYIERQQRFDLFLTLGGAHKEFKFHISILYATDGHCELGLILHTLILDVYVLATVPHPRRGLEIIEEIKRFLISSLWISGSPKTPFKSEVCSIPYHFS